MSHSAGSAVSAATSIGEEVQDLADCPLPADRVPQRNVGLDVVAVAATVLLFDHIAGFGEVDHDGIRGPLGDIERDGQILIIVGVIGAALSIAYWASWGGFGHGRRRADEATIVNTRRTTTVQDSEVR